MAFTSSLGLAQSSENPPTEVEIYLLIGQSNMEGVGRVSKLTDGQKNVPNVQMFHSASVGKKATENKWSPLCPAGWKGTASGGFGLEMSFAKALNTAHPTKQFALIKHAVGGTNLHTQWAPGTSPDDVKNQGNQFKTFIATANKAIEQLEKDNKKPIIKGILWQQGEADSKLQKDADKYGENLAHFIKRNREQFKQYAVDQKPENICFILGQVIPDYTKGSNAHKAYPARESVRAAQLLISKKLPNVHTVPTNMKDYPTHATDQDGYRDKDNIHFNAAGLLKLGSEMAKKALIQ